MAMTMTQKILAAHAGLDHVVPGQLIRADLEYWCWVMISLHRYR